LENLQAQQGDANQGNNQAESGDSEEMALAIAEH